MHLDDDDAIAARRVAKRNARLLVLTLGLIAVGSLFNSSLPRLSGAAGGAGGGSAPLTTSGPAVGGAARAGGGAGSLDADAITPPLTDDGGRPLLGALRTSKYWVWFYADQAGPLVTVCGTDGRVLERGLAMDDVYRRFPELRLDEMGDTPGLSRQLMHAEERDEP